MQKENTKNLLNPEEYFEHFLGDSFGGYQNTRSDAQKEVARKGGLNELDRKELDGLSEIDYPC